MDTAYMSAFSALAGSAIGALASLGTTWLTQHHQERSQRSAQEMVRREKLFGDFIDQASSLFAEAMTHTILDPAKMVPLYALANKLRLFSSPRTVEKAQAVMTSIIEAYYRPNEDFSVRQDMHQESFDILREFTESCRDELR